jgi:hypothetical protein
MIDPRTTMNRLVRVEGNRLGGDFRGGCGVSATTRRAGSEDAGKALATDREGQVCSGGRSENGDLGNGGAK